MQLFFSASNTFDTLLLQGIVTFGGKKPSNLHAEQRNYTAQACLINVILNILSVKQ